MQMQAKLLRVIEQKVLDRVGAVHPIEVDFRLLAATNKDLIAMIKEGSFREDLYYRLGTMLLRVPSLRERAEDIPLLAEHWLRQKCSRPVSLSEPAMEWLMHYAWKGNVRELKSLLDRALSLIEERRHHPDPSTWAGRLCPRRSPPRRPRRRAGPCASKRTSRRRSGTP